MARQLTLALLLALAPMIAAGEPGGLVVIVNQDSVIEKLTRRQLVDLYMGRIRQLPNGKLAVRIDQPPESMQRAVFYRSLVNKSVAEINAYWARLVFTGRAKPPLVRNDDLAVIETVRQNPNAIGYISDDAPVQSVKVISRVGQHTQ